MQVQEELRRSITATLRMAQEVLRVGICKWCLRIVDHYLDLKTRLLSNPGEETTYCSGLMVIS